MKAIGGHERTESETINNGSRVAVTCLDCGSCSVEETLSAAEEFLAQAKCVPDCQNCQNLRYSHRDRPAVPINGTRDMTLYVCPNEGNKWHQYNKSEASWQQIMNPAQWSTLVGQEDKGTWATV